MEMAKSWQGKGRSFVRAGESLPIDRLPSRKSIGPDNVKPEVGLP
jgi:hypothetical protein